MIIEGVDPERLDDARRRRASIPIGGITLDFLKIAFAAWPEWLAEHGLVDRARARRAARSKPRSRRSPPGAERGPTIIAGSTGANRATARLIAAIARAPQGRGRAARPRHDLDDAAWAMIGAATATSAASPAIRRRCCAG